MKDSILHHIRIEDHPSDSDELSQLRHSLDEQEGSALALMHPFHYLSPGARSPILNEIIRDESSLSSLRLYFENNFAGIDDVPAISAYLFKLKRTIDLCGSGVLLLAEESAVVSTTVKHLRTLSWKGPIISFPTRKAYSTPKLGIKHGEQMEDSHIEEAWKQVLNFMTWCGVRRLVVGGQYFATHGDIYQQDEGRIFRDFLVGVDQDQSSQLRYCVGGFIRALLHNATHSHSLQKISCSRVTYRPNYPF